MGKHCEDPTTTSVSHSQDDLSLNVELIFPSGPRESRQVSFPWSPSGEMSWSPSTIRDKIPFEEMHENIWTHTQLTRGGTGRVPTCLSQLSRGHHLSLHPCPQQWGRWSQPWVKFLSVAKISTSGWQLWDPGGYTVEVLWGARPSSTAFWYSQLCHCQPFWPCSKFRAFAVLGDRKSIPAASSETI